MNRVFLKSHNPECHLKKKHKQNPTLSKYFLKGHNLLLKNVLVSIAQNN